MTTDSMLWQRAASFAARSHRHDLRKDGRTPYIAHPVRVAMLVAVEFGETDPDLLAAALLHDVIEDGSTDWDELCGAFGADVADLVAAVSKDARLPESAREAAYDQQLAGAPWKARMIKLADVLDNLADSAPGRSRAEVVARVHRAIAVAGDEPRLARAVVRVRADLTPQEQMAGACAAE